MEEAILLRHAESELNVTATLNGDPAVSCGLTAQGREQARRLGELAKPDVVVTSSFQRARETAVAAWPGVPGAEDAGFDEIAFGRWEGQTYESYREWAWSAGPVDDAPGGGESRVAAITRYVAAYRRVLARPEPTVAVVAHGLVIRYVLLAAEGHPPRQRLDGVPPAEPFRLARDELTASIDLLDGWLEEPAWR